MFKRAVHRFPVDKTDLGPSNRLLHQVSDLHDDGRLLELVQRRRAVEHPLQSVHGVRDNDVGALGRRGLLTKECTRRSALSDSHPAKGGEAKSCVGEKSGRRVRAM